MNKKIFSNFDKKSNLRRSSQLFMLLLVCILTFVFVLELTLPTRPEHNTFNRFLPSLREQFAEVSDLSQTDNMKFTKLERVLKPGLFKASSRFQDKPMAQKTIQSIKSKLKLQCIMKIGGENVAYINIKGVGLKRCGVGDEIDDLFTVMEIRKRSVVIMIIGHKVTLSI